jgi:probable F420-dependent oxidoreductase
MNTTPEHTAHARKVVGDTVFLAPEHKVLLTTDVDEARAIGRKTVELYLDLSNYVNNLKRLGFTDADVAKPASDQLIDAVVAHRAADQIAKRLSQHLKAGADHVAIQVLGDWDQLLPTLTELAGALGLTKRP